MKINPKQLYFMQCINVIEHIAYDKRYKDTKCVLIAGNMCKYMVSSNNSIGCSPITQEGNANIELWHHLMVDSIHIYCD